VKAGLLCLTIAHKDDDGPREMHRHEHDRDHPGDTHQLVHGTLLDPRRTIRGRDQIHQKGARRVGCQAQPEEYGVPRLEYLLHAFAPDPYRVESEGERDENYGGQQHASILQSSQRGSESGPCHSTASSDARDFVAVLDDSAVVVGVHGVTLLMPHATGPPE